MNPVPCYQRDTKLLLQQVVGDSSRNLRTSEVPQGAAYGDEKKMEEVKNLGREFNNE